MLCTGALEQAEALKEHLREMRIDVVLKPFDLDRLLKVIGEALARRSPTPTAHDDREHPVPDPQS